MKQGGNIYFDTSKLENYYVLSNQNEEELMVGARNDVEKKIQIKRVRQISFFGLQSRNLTIRNLKWESPWGVGYPGWHIECSAIQYQISW